MTYFTPEGDPKLFRCGCGTDCTAPPPNPDLLARLDNLRLRVGRPIVVTSGPRCPAWNAREGGASNSDHLTGDGADLACKTSAERWQLLRAVLHGQAPLFTRLGVGRDFLHVGLATRNPGELVWHYYGR